jgi:hypothetical protein
MFVWNLRNFTDKNTRKALDEYKIETGLNEAHNQNYI